MAPFTAWLPARPDQEFDLVIKIVGDGVAGQVIEITAILKALTEQGFEVLAQTGRLDGKAPLSAVRLRLSSKPFHSMGHGCDVLAYLDEDVPDFRRFGLQRGSLLLCEPYAQHWPAQSIPEGVITYPVPFTELIRQCGKGFSGKGLIAAGVLTHLLGIPEETVRARIPPAFRLRYFDAGAGFAREHLVKRDLYTLPTLPSGRRQLLLDTHEAIMLAFGIGHCGCGSACASGLDRSPLEWVGEHLDTARQMVSSLKTPTRPGVQVYRGGHGKIMALLGSVDPSTVNWSGDSPDPVVLVAADVPDTIRLAGAATQLVRCSGAGQVWVAVDERLTNRIQAVAIETLADATRTVERPAEPDDQLYSPSMTSLVEAEWDGEPGADVGYVAWGTAQGVVRDAVALCRSFGLHVAALYPKVLQPPPIKELESFAATVKRVVVVEPDGAARFTDLVKRFTSFRPAAIMPESGTVLTPMDIFLREGLGVL